MKSKKSPLYEYSPEWSKETQSNIYETLMNMQFPIAVSRVNVCYITFAEMLQLGLMLGINFEIYSNPTDGCYTATIYYKNETSSFESFQLFNEMTEFVVNKICEIIKDNQL